MHPDAVNSGIHTQAERIKCVAVVIFDCISDLFHANATHPAYSMGEIAVNHILPNSDCLKYLCGLV